VEVSVGWSATLYRRFPPETVGRPPGFPPRKKKALLQIK
jgi:hypothetical protein